MFSFFLLFQFVTKEKLDLCNSVSDFLSLVKLKSYKNNY